MSNKVFWGLLMIVVAGFVLIATVGKSKDSTPGRSEIKSIEGVKDFGKLDNKHVQQTINYPMSPPAGGNHNPVWVGCDQKIYDQPVQKEMAVHALEHGAVWISRSDKLDKSQIEKLSEKVKASGATFMTPFEDQKAPIVLTAWSKQLEVRDAQDPRIDQFLVKYRKNGANAPEVGATCTAPQGGM